MDRPTPQMKMVKDKKAKKQGSTNPKTPKSKPKVSDGQCTGIPTPQMIAVARQINTNRGGSAEGLDRRSTCFKEVVYERQRSSDVQERDLNEHERAVIEKRTRHSHRHTEADDDDEDDVGYYEGHSDESISSHELGETPQNIHPLAYRERVLSVFSIDTGVNSELFDRSFSTCAPCGEPFREHSNEETVVPHSPTRLVTPPIRWQGHGRLKIDDELEKRVDKIRPVKFEYNKVGTIIRDITYVVISYMNDSDDFFSWSPFNSGSAFDKTKIVRVDEFDILLIGKIKGFNVVQDPASVPAGIPKYFCALKVLGAARLISNKPEVTQLFSKCSSTATSSWLSPKAFKQYVKSLVEEAILTPKMKEALDTASLRVKAGVKALSIQADKGTSAAITLCIERPDGTQYCVDLVPAVENRQWPRIAESWESNWLPDDVVTKCKERCFLVPKLHFTEYPKMSDDCRLWRYGFNAAEKTIILHADGTHNPESPYKTCRKEVLRLLKEDLEKAFKQGNIPDMCSYFVKTICLHLFEACTDMDEWLIDPQEKDSTLRLRYLEALSMFIDALKCKRLNHYFIEGENLLDQVLKERNGVHQVETFRKALEKTRDKYNVTED